MDIEIRQLITRYLLILLAIFSFNLIYLILLPITIYPVYFILNLFYQVNLQGTSFFISGKEIEIIRACVGASAVLLLIILNLATPKINIKKRTKLFSFGIISFLIFNWLRIIVLSTLFISGALIFEQIHFFTWYFINTLAVFAIWIISIKFFKINKNKLLFELGFYLYFYFIRYCCF